ncbi:hypothetical protein RIF29_16808 [Crotalaria pallida]|uniref:C2H2-type domain-containing protein n=1 Tax=Crotalaria pallida TaxID=3830 RepID=A0AAN9FFY0_CROPI
MSKHRTHRNSTTIKDVYQNQNQSQQQPKKREKQASCSVLTNFLLTCRDVQVLEQLKQKKFHDERVPKENNNKCKKKNCSSFLCNEVNVMERPEKRTTEVAHKKRVSKMSAACNSNNDASYSSRSMRTPQNEINGFVPASSSNSSSGGSSRGMHNFRRLSGCYERGMVVDPVLGLTRDPSMMRSTICSYPHCGEIFMNAESLENHQAVKHAVSELGPDDSSKNIVEIIFQSSWLKKQSPMFKIDRILKVHNTQKTIMRFEEYRDLIKAKATQQTKKHPRCVADGNELLRFHCTTFMCSLGLNGSSNLCNFTPQCNACNMIKNGFDGANKEGILTSATSGKAHDKVNDSYVKRAMLVCRVVAGRVKKNAAEGGSDMEEYDSVAVGDVGAYSDVDELYVFNHRAILICFVVIYRTF